MHRRLGDTPLGWEDYVLLPEDGRRHEIIEGDAHVTPAPVAKHQWVSFNLAAALRDHVRPRGLGAVLLAPIDVLAPFRGKLGLDALQLSEVLPA